MSKAICVGYLAKVSASNVNASHTEGNVIVAKKVTLPDGSALPYISGQAIRRMLRDRLQDLGYPLSEPHAEISGQEVKPPVRPWDFIDEDLFGYMDATGGKRRTSPTRVSAAVGLFPFQGDRDLGTRSFEHFQQEVEPEVAQRGGNMFETEIYANLFKGTLLIELDRVGIFPTRETKEKQDRSLPVEERRARMQALLEALNLLWGGGRTARLLSDLSPRFFAYCRLGVKHPVFIEALDAEYEEGKYLLNLNSLCNALEKFTPHRKKTLFGLEAGVFGNEDEILERLSAYGEVLPVHEAITEAKGDVNTLWQSESSV
ncbi:MAG: type I-B CRISPR-associated protein Cas7/Cst2/DevR [Armatimonadota bacterium]|nr:type I-B CRISPR-associated protein Cas7/Cst2/DevR [bacterium]MCS7137552.1 type I-B CRISPR-associated protein Cas7/Cst2/DevR [Candidatus Caldarchaeum sp.]MDW8289519.1 type I-B CRISPR-associated protein Cas7/Cst2/DevR [Armatimonadota bacterium]